MDVVALAPGRGSHVHAILHAIDRGACTVHIVDAGVDTGPILAQAAVPVLPTDDAETLHRRIQGAEHKLLPAVIHWIAEGNLVLGAPPRFRTNVSASFERSYSPWLP